MARMPKKPKKPKSKTVKSMEAYIKRHAAWKKKCAEIEAEKKKKERLRNQLSGL
jgi:hypothetical protein